MVEVMLSIALFVGIASTSALALHSIDQQTSIDRTTSLITSALRRAELLSVSMERDTAWGVKLTTSTLTIFQGLTYDTRVSSADSLVSLPSSLEISGLDEVRFAKATGLPHTTGSITVSSTYETRTITVSSDGTIQE